MTEPEPTVYFRRREFHGDFNTRPPRWHTSSDGLAPDWGTFTALCGYSYGNTRGGLLISRTATPKPKGDMCAKCARKMTLATPET